VLQNIERLKEAKIPFSINTVFDYNKTKSLKKLTDYVCQQPISQYGFSASFTINDNTYIDEIIDQVKLVVLQLKENNFDIRNRFRFYNEVIGQPGKTCHAGVDTFAIGTKLEVWPCQSLIDKKPLGYFDENIKNLLATSKNNKYFFNRTLLPQCTDCSVLNWCRGGCRAVHLNDMEAVENTCKIKQEIINFILRETQGYNNRSYHNYSCDHSTKNNGLDTHISNYINGLPKEEIKLVETPPLLDD
jgi:radical SAM protein with 4Fe4S-binding SPASM domain